jgi:hypothetical protein
VAQVKAQVKPNPNKQTSGNAALSIIRITIIIAILAIAKFPQYITAVEIALLVPVSAAIYVAYKSGIKSRLVVWALFGVILLVVLALKIPSLF